MDPLENNPGQEREVTDIETARLALRGALQSVHSLQDLNARLKGEIQDYLHREKALNERMIRLQQELNDSYSRLDQHTSIDRDREAAAREALRQEIILEQNAKWQTEIDALRQSVQNWNEVRRQKETELRMIKEALLQKEAEVFALQKEKISSEEKAHRDLVEAISKARSGVQMAIDEVVRSKDHDIQNLKNELAQGPIELDRRLQQIEQDYRRKEQNLLHQFRERQQALELDWTQREKELWEQVSRSRQTLEAELKKQWENRTQELERSFDQRRSFLENQTQQKEHLMDQRLSARENELLSVWAAKESALVQDWARKEKALAEQFQKALDEERQSAMAEIARVKKESETWRAAQEETWHSREIEFKKAQSETEDMLRDSFRHREEDLLAKHQDALGKSQKQISDLLARASEKDTQARVAMEKLAMVVKERDALSERLESTTRDSQQRLMMVEQQLKTRERELQQLTQRLASEVEVREAHIQNLTRKNTAQESDVKVLQEKIERAEIDRDASQKKAVELETDFMARRQSLEQAYQTEMSSLRERLTVLSQTTSQKEQTYQRRVAELETDLLERVSQAQTLSDQLSVARTDFQELLQTSTTRDDRLASIERELANALEEVRSLTHHLKRQEEVRDELQSKNEALQGQLREETQRFEERLAHAGHEADMMRGRLEQRVVELEGLFRQKSTDAQTLQIRLNEAMQAFKTLESVSSERQTELSARLQALEQASNAEKEAFDVQLQGLRQKDLALQQSLEARIRELETDIARRAAVQADLQGQVQSLQETRQDISERSAAREAQLLDEVHDLKNKIQVQKEQLTSRVLGLERERHQTEEALHAKALELEQRLGQKSTTLKTVQDELSKAHETTEQLGKRLTTVEAHLQRAEGQLKAKETELHALINASHKQAAETQETYQRRLLDLQNQKLKLETDLKGVQDLLARTESARVAIEKDAALLETQRLSQVQKLEERLVAQERAHEERFAHADQAAQTMRGQLEKRILDVEGQLRQKMTDLQTLESRLKEAVDERKSFETASDTRKTQLSKEVDELKEKVKFQKEQLASRVMGLERERHQIEDALQAKILELEQSGSQKTTAIKTLQEQLTKARERSEQMEKRLSTVEAHLQRAEGQLKAKETELHSLISSSHKELNESQETYQRRILELQNNKLKLETDLKSLQESLARADGLRASLEKEAAQRERTWRAAEGEWKGAAEAKQKEAGLQQTALTKRIDELENQVRQKTVELQTFEARLSVAEDQRTAFEKDVQAGRSQIVAMQKQILDLKTGLQERESELKENHQSLLSLQKERQTLLDSLEAERKGVALERQAWEFTAAQTDQARQKENAAFEDRLLALQQERAQVERTLQKQVTDLQETLTLRVADLEDAKQQLQTTLQERLAFDKAVGVRTSEALQRHDELEKRYFAERDKAQLAETTLAAQVSELQSLQAELSAIREERQTLISQLASERQKSQTDLRAAANDHVERAEALQKRIQNLEINLGAERSQFEQRMAAVQKDRAEKEETLHRRLLELQDVASGRAAEIQGLKQRLHEAEQARFSLEKTTGEQLGKAQQSQTDLEKRFFAERGRAEQAESQLAAQLSEIKELKEAVASARQDRETLLKTLSEQREKAMSDLSALQKAAQTSEQEARRQMHVLEKEWRDRLNAAAAQSAERVATLQSQVTVLEKAQVAEKADFEKRLALFVEERARAEEALQTRLISLQEGLARQQTLATELTQKLDASEKTRDILEKLSRQTGEEWKADRQALAQQLNAQREQIVRLEKQLSAREENVQDIQQALAQAQKDRQALTESLQHAKVSFDLERTGLESHFERSSETLRFKFMEAQKQTAAQALMLEEQRARLMQLEERLKDSEQRRSMMEKAGTLQSTEAENRRLDLETHLRAERERSGHMETRLTAQVSELKELKEALAAARQERESVLVTLASQRDKASQDLADQQKALQTSEADSRRQIQALEKEWKERLSAASTHASERIDALQAQVAQLEQTLSRERHDYEVRLAGLVDERARAEAALQARLSQIQDQLARQQTLAQEMTLQIAASEKERESLEKASRQNGSNWKAQQAAIQTQLDAYREQIRGLETELAARQTDLKDVHASLAAAQADRQALIESLQTHKQGFSLERSALESLMEKTVTDSTHAMDVLRARLVEAEKQVAVHLNALDDQRSRVVQLEARLKESEQRRVSIEQLGATQLAEAEKCRRDLETRLSAERDRAGLMETKHATQVSELKELHNALASARQERETLLETLSAQREKATADLMAQQKMLQTAESEARRQTQALEKEWRDRLAAASAQSTDRITALQAQVTQLEQTLTQERHQVEKRLAALVEERYQAEAALQDRLTALSENLARQQTMAQEMALKLAASEKERESQEKAARMAGSDWKTQQTAFQTQLEGQRDHVRQLEKQLTSREHDLKEVQAALSAVQKDRQILTEKLESQRQGFELERAALEVKLAEGQKAASQAIAKLESQWRQRLDTAAEESTQTVEALRQRIVEIEQKWGERNAALEKDWRERLSASGVQYTERLAGLRSQMASLEAAHRDQTASLEQALAAQKADFEKRITVFQQERTKEESILRERLMSLQDKAGHKEADLSALAKDLEGELAAARQERDALASELTLQREESVKALRAAEGTAKTLESQWRSRLDALDKSAQERVARVTTEAAERLEAFEARVEELEKRLASERSDFQKRLEAQTAQAERVQAPLQQRLIELERAVAERSGSLKAVQEKLSRLEEAKARLEKTAATDAAQAARTYRQMEERLAAEGGRAEALVGQIQAHQLQIKELDAVLSAVREERQALSESLEAQRQKFMADMKDQGQSLSQRERMVAQQIHELEKEYTQRLSQQEKDFKSQSEALHERARALEADLARRESAAQAIEKQLRREYEARLHEEREKARKLQTDLAALSSSVSDLESRCATLQGQKETNDDHFEQERFRFADQIKGLETRLKEQKAESKRTVEALELELRSQSAGVSKESVDRLENVQRRVRELEQLMDRKDTEIGVLREQMDHLEKASAHREKEMVRTHAKELEEMQSRFLGKMKEIRAESEEALRRVQNEYLSQESVASPDLRGMEERRVLEAKLREAQAELEQAKVREPARLADAGVSKSLMEEWVFGFAHQVRNPLGIIRSVAESLKCQVALSRGGGEAIDAILKAVDGLNGRLKEFIEFSKPVKPFCQALDVRTTVEKASSGLRERMKRQRVDFKMDIPHNCPTLPLDPDHMQTILVNLMSNALDAMPDGGKLRVEARYAPSGGKLELRVQDTGRGIPKEHMKEVGRPFFSTKPGAVGLGLALVKRLLRAYHGDVVVESKPNQGTTVLCRLQVLDKGETAWAA